MPHLSTERGKGMLGGAAHFYRCFTCADGKEISLGSIEPQFYAEMLARTGAPEELAQAQMNPANWDDYAEKLAALFATKTQAEWCELLEGTDACFAPVLGIEEARTHPHMQARGAYVEHDGIWHTAPAPRFSRTPGAVRSSADDGADVVASWQGAA
jgi:alpha-methylacyl-CoA racemase